ncbi:putative bifunctional diguanylate cyclase/phosphodiesterase [Agarivorans gilvus]|nr:bifunctional diguanylate cyclase/phosphodiesterase [Agarivorans gilvus]
MFGLFILQVSLFSIFPLYFTALKGPQRKVAFYIYLALVLLIGGFFGNVYSIPITPEMNVSGGNLCYGAFMMSSVLFVLVERDVFILRHVLKLLIFVDLFNVLFSSLAATTLQSDGVINPHNTSSALFELSTPFIILGGVLIILELLTLLFCFEKLKKLNLPALLTGVLYIALFVLVLCLDGILFPLIAFGFSPEIIAIVLGGLNGKLLAASSFALPLLLFIAIKHQSFVNYLEAEDVRWRLLFTTSNQLMKELSAKDYGLEQAATVFENASEGLAIVNAQGLLLQANDTFCEMLKLNKALLNQQTYMINTLFQHNGLQLHHAQILSAHWRGEVTFGERYRHQGLLAVNRVKSEQQQAQSYVFSLVNIDEQKSVQRRLNHLARHDQLTQLPNRRVLDEQLAALDKTATTLLVIDLDHFKDVNDSFGHAAGDEVLQAVSTRLLIIQNAHSEHIGILSRTGGDEFALLIKSYDVDLSKQLIHEIQQQLKKVILISGNNEIYISATIGASLQKVGEQRNLLQEADAALYEAKRTQRGSYGFYEDRLTQESQRKLSLSAKLKLALENQDLLVYYQPQYCAKNGQVRGVEALARWHDEDLGWVSPGEFIPVAEATGIIDRLGDYVLEKACNDAASWLKQGLPPITMSVNVSAHQLRFGQFIQRLSECLNRSQLPQHLLELELTESVFIERENEAIPLLKQIKQLGVNLAIDDFGTGYSSLSYLSKIPWDTLKIDRSFISQIPDDQEQCQLTATIIKMAHNLNLNVVVEGVETQAQLDFVSQRGSQIIQGFYYSPAIEKDQLEALLAAQSSA